MKKLEIIDDKLWVSALNIDNPCDRHSHSWSKGSPTPGGMEKRV